jgi:hypothetical protein
MLITVVPLNWMPRFAAELPQRGGRLGRDATQENGSFDPDRETGRGVRGIPGVRREFARAAACLLWRKIYSAPSYV